jgi:hypothetical protein
MKRLNAYLSLAAFLGVAAVFLAFKVADADGIKGWWLTGDKPDSYKIAVEKDAERKSNVASLKSTKEVVGFGSLMQTFAPTMYIGKRVRMTSYIKSADVKDWAGMWFRIDGADKKTLGFDNMQKRAIKGSQGWKKYEIVLDVPAGSKLFAYGALLSGTGSIWVDDLKFEVVPNTVPVTDMNVNESPVGPQNADFEQAD